MHVGDEICEVNGTNVQGCDPKEVVQLLVSKLLLSYTELFFFLQTFEYSVSNQQKVQSPFSCNLLLTIIFYLEYKLKLIQHKSNQNCPGMFVAISTRIWDQTDLG